MLRSAIPGGALAIGAIPTQATIWMASAVPSAARALAPARSCVRSPSATVASPVPTKCNDLGEEEIAIDAVGEDLKHVCFLAPTDS